MRKLRITAIILAAILVVFSLAACSNGGEGDQGQQSSSGKSFVSIATGGPAGTYYPLGGAMAKILNESDYNFEATAQSTGASIENIELITIGDAEIGIIQNDSAYYAAEGIELFKDRGEYKNLKGLASLYPEVIHIITRANSGIESVSDLKGKNVAVGAPGSGTELVAKQILDAYGITYNDLGKADYLSFDEATEGIISGQIDVAFVVAGVPTSAVTELATTHDIKLVSIDEEMANKLADEYPYFTPYSLETTEYKQEADVPTIAVQAILAVDEGMSEETAYNITKLIFENLDQLANAHAMGKMITLDGALEGMSIDVHPGALKYFEENGIK